MMHLTILGCLVLLLVLDMKTTTGFVLKMSGKGFGNVPKTVDTNILKSSRPQEHRSVHGSFAKLLSKTSIVFEGLKNENGCSRDIYVRLNNSQIFWFIGKINHKSSVTAVSAVNFYSALIIEYSKALRPLELAGKGKAMSDLQIWTARGNSEMDIVQNIGMLERVEFSAIDDASLNVVSEDIGFEPEIYMNGEMGFRVTRDSNGAPVDEPFEVKMGTSEDMKRAGI